MSTGLERDGFIQAFKEDDRERGFNLNRDVLLRAAVIQVDKAHYEFIWSNHHILMDGWCQGVLNSDFFEIYSSYLENKPFQLPPVIPYRNYIQWLENQDKEKARSYWGNLLAGYNEAVGIPVKESPGIVHEGYKREEIPFVIDNERTRALNQWAGKRQVTLSTIIQAIWGILLAIYNDKRDVVFGIVVSGRPSEIDGVESMVGLFINTIPVRMHIEETATGNDLVGQVQKQSLEGEPYHYYSLAEIQSLTPLKQNLLDHFLTFLNYPIEEEILKQRISGKNNAARVANLEISNIKSLERSNYNLDVLISCDEQIDIVLRYNTNIYDSNFMKKMLVHMEEVIDQILNNNDINIKDIIISHDRLIAESKIPLDDDGDFDL